MILMIDNYDSFTYNLVQYMGELGADIEVVRNDQITLDDIEKMRPEKLVISPGPCTPQMSSPSMSAVLLGPVMRMRAPRSPGAQRGR